MWLTLLFQQAISARSKAGRFRYQPVTVQVAKEVNKPLDEIHNFWRENGLEEIYWWKAERFMEKWISGLAFFVVPVDEDLRRGVRQEMWNNKRVWDIAARWAISTPLTDTDVNRGRAAGYNVEL